MPCALRRVVLALLLLGAGSMLSAQFGPNLPIPGIPGRRHKTPSQGSGKNDSKDNKRTVSADGHVRSISDKQMEVAVDDGRLLTLRLDPTTAFQRNGASTTQSAVLRMMTVHVDAEEDGEGNLTAVTVNILKDPPKDVEQPAVPAPWPAQAMLERPTLPMNLTRLQATHRSKHLIVLFSGMAWQLRGNRAASSSTKKNPKKKSPNR